jgi:uncharacterized protein (DUF2141 family)
MFDFAKRNVNVLLVCCASILYLGCETKPTSNQTTSNQTATADQAPTRLESESAIEPTKPVDSPSVVQMPITIEVTGFQNAEGNCRIAIFLGPDRFNDPDFAIAKEVVAIADGHATWDSSLELPLERINPGDSFSLAVSAYHDQNENQKLDKNALGMPLERYGFSNNPKRGFGPPKYRETSIEVPVPSDPSSTDAKPLSIQIQIK